MCVCVCVRARVCECVISGISILSRIFANPLNTHSFYIRLLPQLFSCGTIPFLSHGNVAQFGAFDSCIKLKQSIVT